jgi:hypothetical protein
MNSSKLLKKLDSSHKIITDNKSKVMSVSIGKASFKKYVTTPPRSLLTSSNNDGTSDNPPHPLPEDSGNWSGCKRNSGVLVGTYRDISACYYKAKTGITPTKQDLKSITVDQAHAWLKEDFWDKFEGDKLTDQDVANITCHIYMHYGNIAIVQRALNKLGENVSEDGRAGGETNEALRRQTKKNPIRTFNTIREELRKSYAKDSYNAKAFLDLLNKYYPPKEDKNKVLNAIIIGGTILLAIAAIVLGVMYRKEIISLFKKK